jgi:hypothetical protein
MTAEVSAPSWQRPPFEPGHTLSLRSGAWSPRVQSALALELVKDYAAWRPDLAASYPHELAALCRIEARAIGLDAWLVEHSPVEEGREGRMSILKEWRLLEGRAQAMRRSLGLNLEGDAQARRDISMAQIVEADLSKIAENGRRYIVEHEAQATESQAAS